MNHLAIKYGIRMFAGFAILFLFFHILGLSHHYELRMLNGAVHLGFLYLLIRDFRREQPESRDNYISAVALGMNASVLAVVAFTFCMFLFLTFNEPFFQKLQAQSPLPEYFRPFTASLYILMEGIAVSLIGSYIITRIVDSRVERRQEMKAKMSQSEAVERG